VKKGRAEADVFIPSSEFKTTLFIEMSEKKNFIISLQFLTAL
jgi:hypothetical protein